MSKTLKDILNKKREQDERNLRPKVDWFSLSNGSSVYVQFLQELGDESPTYNKERGAARYLVEHVSPHNFLRKAECSMEREGRCFACEMNQVETSLIIDGQEKKYPWSQKTNMYVQLITEDGKVKVLSRPAPGSVFNYLYEYAETENKGSLTGKTFKISKGSNKNDKWEFMPSNKELKIPADPELVDLNEAVGITMEYEKQKSFYMPQGQSEVTQEEKPTHAESAW